MKKQLIVMLMVMGHICILMSSCGSSEFLEFQITTDEYDQQYPEIYGDFIICDHKTDEVISVHGYNENNYRRPLGSFQLAKRRYQNIDSEKVAECEEWIEKCEEESEKGLCSGTFLLLVFMCFGIFAEGGHDKQN